jgi:uncharacterized FlaG/YvyC family protein
MPLDGLSSSNTGMYRFMNPTENILQAELVAKHQSEEVIKKAEKSENAKNNTDRDPEEKERDLQGRDSSTTDNEEDERLKKEKKYNVKFNKTTEMIEFIDKISGSVVETITPDDLLTMMSKTSSSSGILVDREI